MRRGRRTVNLASARGDVLVPSPGGWRASSGSVPGWNWVPPCGATLNVDALPLWANLWRRTPLLDRFAYPWLWHHGYWLVAPAGRATGGGEPSGDRAPRRPPPTGGQAAATRRQPGGPHATWDTD